MSGGRTWFSASDLADLALPGLPRVKRKVNELATERRWALQVDRGGEPMARSRAGRGGGLEYHVSLLPPSALTELVRRGLLEPAPASANDEAPSAPLAKSNNVPPPRDQAWAWLERQSHKVKDEAQRRLKAVDAVEALERTGQTRTSAVASVAGVQDVAASTLWNWLALVAGVPSIDRLPRLAPRRQGGGLEAEIHPDAWKFFVSDYLRPERPTYASCYWRLRMASAAHRWGEPPSVKTLQRRLEREIDGRLIIQKRHGDDALRRSIPSQQRTVADLSALQLVNIDGHRWDVFVKWPDGHVARPIMVAIQDVYSRKFLAWRIGETESAVLTRLAFADVFRKFGVPEGCLLDNGRAFASKWITGGARTRYRFQIRPEDPTGLLTALGVEIHWAKPYRGSSKPIERGFRDLCDHGAKHPAFAGAYTGNSPVAKPENYGDRAVDLDVFTRVASQVLEAHNARLGRRTEAANGTSFDQAFEASFTRHPVRKATPEQLRMALLAAEHVSTDRRTGEIAFYGNRYGCDVPPRAARAAASRPRRPAEIVIGRTRRVA